MNSIRLMSTQLSSLISMFNFVWLILFKMTLGFCELRPLLPHTSENTSEWEERNFDPFSGSSLRVSLHLRLWHASFGRFLHHHWTVLSPGQPLACISFFFLSFVYLNPLLWYVQVQRAHLHKGIDLLCSWVLLFDILKSDLLSLNG